MAIPATLSSVPSTTPYIQYVATSGQTIFDYPFPITQDSDLIVVANGVTLATDSGYTTANVGTSTGGSITFTSGRTAGDIITLYRDIPIERLTQIAQNSGFNSTAFNAEFNNIYLLLQQLSQDIDQCLQIPNTNNPAPTVSLTPASYANKYLAFDSNGNPTPADLTSSGSLTKSILGGLLYPQSSAETTASVTPKDLSYPYGVPERYGAVGDGTTDDTQALTDCIASNDTVTFTQNKTYGVSTITFPQGGPHFVNFNGARIRGIATAATDCVVRLEMEGTTFLGYNVDLNFSQNYLCGTWWYCSTAASQYNVFLGMKHTYAGGVQTSSSTTVRALIYGALEGNTSTSDAQSENQIYGWRTRGCQNPFYSNHSNGVLQFTDAIFVSLNEEWTGHTGFSFADALVFEAVEGLINVKGGEFQLASAGGTYAASILSECFFEDIIIEAAYPIKVGAVRTRFSGGRFLQDGDTECFVVAGSATGILYLNDMHFIRPAGVGSYSNAPLVDASSASAIVFASAPSSGATSATLSGNWTQPTDTYNVTFSDAEVRACTFTNGATSCTWTGGLTSTVSTTAYVPYEVVLSDTSSFEYRWTCVGGDVRLVKGLPNTVGAVTVRYRNHRMSMTAGDANVYILNTEPTDSILDVVGFDPVGYSTTGWTLTTDNGSSNTMTATTNAGPMGYPSNEISLDASGTGAQCIATYGNPAALSDLNTSALKVIPGQLYWLSAWCNISGGTNGKLSVRFFDSSGTKVSDVVAADSGAIPAGSWKYVEGPIVVPATAAFMCVGAWANASTLEITDVRLRRAS